MFSIFGKILARGKPSEIRALASRMGVKVTDSVADMKNGIAAAYSSASPTQRKLLLASAAATVASVGITGVALRTAERSEEAALSSAEGLAKLKATMEAEGKNPDDTDGNGLLDNIESQIGELMEQNRALVTGDLNPDQIWGIENGAYADVIERQGIAENIVERVLRSTGWSLETFMSVRKAFLGVEDYQLTAMMRRRNSR